MEQVKDTLKDIPKDELKEQPKDQVKTTLKENSVQKMIDQLVANNNTLSKNHADLKKAHGEVCAINIALNQQLTELINNKIENLTKLVKMVDKHKQTNENLIKSNEQQVKLYKELEDLKKKHKSNQEECLKLQEEAKRLSEAVNNLEKKVPVLSEVKEKAS